MNGNTSNIYTSNGQAHCVTYGAWLAQQYKARRAARILRAQRKMAEIIGLSKGRAAQ